MKTIALSLILSLSISSALAKGGDFDWIPGPDLSTYIKKRKQVLVNIETHFNSPSFEELAQDFTNFIYEIHGGLLNKFDISRGNSIYRFCLEANTFEDKKPLVDLIKEEFKRHPKSISVIVKDDLTYPCKK